MSGGSRDVPPQSGGGSALSLGRAVVEMVEDGVVEFGADGLVADVNDAFVDATGRDRGSLVGEPVSALVAGDGASATATLERALADDGEPGVESLHVALATADDGRRPAELRLRAVEPDGADDDERRAVGLVFERGDGDESDTGDGELFENLPGMAFRCRNERGRPMLEVSPGAATLTGYDPVELESDAVSWGEDVVHPADREDAFEAVQAGIADDGEYEVTYRIRTRRGDTKWVWELGRIVADGYVEGSVADVTRYRETRKRLRRERDRTEKIIETAPVILVVFDEDGKVVDANSRAERRLGIGNDDDSYETVGDRDVFDEDDEFVPVEDRPTSTVFETGEPVEDWLCQVETANGERRWFSINAGPVLDDDGDVERVIVTGEDVTDLKRSQHRLTRRRDELESELGELFGRVTDAFLALDEDWNLTYVNERAAELLDRDEVELLGSNVWEEFDEAAGSEAQREFERALESQEPVTLEEYYPPLDSWFSLSVYPSETGLSVYFRDVSDRVKREEALTALHGVAQDLPHAETKEAIAGRVVTAARELLGLGGATVYLHDAAAGELVPAAYSDDAMEQYGDLLPVPATAEDSVTGNAFVGGETVQYADVRESDLVANEVADVRRTLFVPIGDHGVLVVGDDRVREFDDETVELAELLTANAESEMDRVDRESELRERERELEQYHTLTQTASDAIVTVDERGVVQSANPAVEDVFGYESDSLVGEHMGVLMPADARAAQVAELERLSDDDAVREQTYVEMVGERADGSEVPVSVSFSEYEHDGERHFTGIVRDISERKQRERELERYETIVETVDDGIYVLDDEGRFTMVNEAQARMLGYDREELLGENRSIVAPPDASRLGSDAEAALLAGERDGATVGTAIEDADGNEIPVETTLSLIEHEDGFERVGVVRDVSGRRQRERELERYETIVETVDDGVYALDPDGRFVMANDAFCEMIGWERDELLGRPAEVVHSEEVSERASELAASVVAGERDGATLELDLVTRDGDAVPVESRFGPYPYDGDSYGRCGVTRDVSERRERERTLELFETVVETIDDGVYVLDDEFDFVMVNDAYVEMTGYDRDELVGSHCSLVIDDEVSAESSRLISKIAADEGSSATLEADIHRKDGTKLRAESNFTSLPSPDSEMPWKVGVVRDVSERVERERELHDRIRQQAVTVELGRLALGEPDLDVLFEKATELVAETLDTEYCELLDLDEDAGKLVLRQGVGWDDGYVGSAWQLVDENSQAGYTLGQVGPVVVEDLDDEDRFRVPEFLRDHDVRSGVSVEIGSVDDPWGVLGAHATGTREFSDHDASFLESVANVLSTAVQRNRRVREIERNRQHLAALDNLNAVVRDINVALAESSTREEIARVVCERLVEAEDYAFAWIGEVDRNRGTVTPSTWAGEGESYLDDLELSLDDSATARGPTGRAVEERSMQTTPSFEADDAMDPWQDEAAEHGFESSAAVPLVYEGVLYGVLNVYAGRPAAFEGREGEVIGQLSEVVGHAIRAVERKEALMSESVVELEFRTREVVRPLLDATTDGGTVRFERTVQTDAGSYLRYVMVEGVSESAFRDAVERTDGLSSPRLVTDRGDGLLFELTLDEPPITSTVASLGGRVREAMVTDGELEAQVEVPHSVDVRSLVEALEDVAPDVELVSQRSRQRDEDAIRRSAMETLTDKQLAAVESAFHAGYFEWPRQSTAEELAESIGVAAPTLHQHLRKGERKLLGGYFER